MERLAALLQERRRRGGGLDYPIGAGDVIEISVPAMQEIGAKTVRVSGEGAISLPFVGLIQAEGLREEELAQAIRARLEKYMYNPRVAIFIKEYRSRQVAVLGAVGKPGLYSLSSGADTIMDVVSRAGGILPTADPRIHFVPAEPVEKEKAKELALFLPEGVLAKDPSPLILKKTDPIFIDIKELAYGGNQIYLSLPVRPGDVIMVPGGGQILVEGWVEKPGAYSVTPGLTVSGIVAAAGGPSFPADTGSVKIFRAAQQGGKSVLVANLQDIKAGKEADIALQGGDIVEIASVTSKLIPYALYKFITTVVSVGVSGNVPIF
ncbi:MAG: hypothetical protein A3F90_07370 [Deltaproteobacteria bacterium RIFCSPLOWO2_12_FULL_60_19]|nr:MAG: hypothetical protein A3F90_07370 [Deltaproteobacteria bacterium RIFCSPLOWO2_12_FULL_60_19]